MCFKCLCYNVKICSFRYVGHYRNKSYETKIVLLFTDLNSICRDFYFCLGLSVCLFMCLSEPAFLTNGLLF